MLTVRDVVQQLKLKLVAGEGGLGREIRSGYVGDLLSCVMAKAAPGCLWVTVQGHPNVVAVATLVSMAGIVVAEGARIDPTTVEKAEHEGVPLLASSKPSFAVVADLAAMGVKGGEG